MNLFCVFVVLLLSQTAHAQSYHEWCDRAAEAIEQDSLTQAEACIRQALKVDPANPHNALLFSNLGTLQRRQGKPDLALESFSYALNIAPRMVPVLVNRATLYMEMGRLDAARVDYSLVLDIEPAQAEALLMRAYIYMQQRDYKAAQSDYERLLKIQPGSYGGQLGMATLKQKIGKPDEALMLLDAMAELGSADLTDGQRAVLHVARANVEHELERQNAALVDLEEAVRLDASLPDIYILRGQIYLSQKKKEAARKDFMHAISLGVQQADLKEWLQQCR